MIKLDYLPYIPSPNKSIRTAKPAWIVLHCPVGTYGSCINTFKNPKSQVSAHFVVSKKGEITCMVKTEQKAWHTKGFNDVSIGIEMEDGDIKDKKKNCITDKNWCTEAEYAAVAELVATCMKKHNIKLEHVIGHNDPMLQKPPYNNDHQDPGKAGWDWVKFRALVTKFLGETKGDEKA